MKSKVAGSHKSDIKRIVEKQNKQVDILLAHNKSNERRERLSAVRTSDPFGDGLILEQD